MSARAYSLKHGQAVFSINILCIFIINDNNDGTHPRSPAHLLSGGGAAGCKMNTPQWNRMAARVNAKERWKILKSAILSAGRGESVNSALSTASVRRFTSFGLFTVSPSDPPRKGVKADPSEEGGLWMLYTPVTQSDKTTSDNERDWPAGLIRVLTQSPSLEDMIGFNNTGNVCIWPSEEVLAHYCVSHAHLFRGCSVCELGCGMSALAGVLLGTTQQPSQVLVTDGNQASVDNVSVIVSRNRERFRGTVVSSQLLCWDESFLSNSSPHDGAFDWLICADCLFFTDLHKALVHTMIKLLRPERGRVLVFAPGRSGSLEQFIRVAMETFKVEREDRYDEVVYNQHKELLRTEPELYQPDLHYPTLLRLTPLIT